MTDAEIRDRLDRHKLMMQQHGDAPASWSAVALLESVHDRDVLLAELGALRRKLAEARAATLREAAGIARADLSLRGSGENEHDSRGGIQTALRIAAELERREREG